MSLSLALLLATLPTQPAGAAATQTAATREDDGLALAIAEQEAFRQAALLAAPSVVTIETVGGLDRLGDVLLNTGATTGTVVGPGRVLSSAFNFAGEPSAIFVTLEDGSRLLARRRATDTLRQLVLLEVEGLDQAPAIRAADLATVRVGQWAIALGRTYRQPGPNISVGLISARQRVWGLAIGTDAKVSPANYGGPLVDIEGRAVGVLVPLSPQERGRTAGVEWYDSGIGFAIPIDAALESARRLEAGEDLHRGLLGLSVAGAGLVAEPADIDRLHPLGPAEVAGLQPGDRIVEIAGESIRHAGDFRRTMAGRYAGDSVSVTVERGGESDTAEPGGQKTPREPSDSNAPKERETVTVSITLAAELTPYEYPGLGVLLAADATVREVFEGSPAAGTLEVGDRISAIGDRTVETAAAAIDALGRGRANDEVALTVLSKDAGQAGKPSRTLTLPTGTLTPELPTKLPLPRLAESQPAAGSQRGRIKGTVDGTELEFAAYLPTQASETHPAGLLVWLAAGDPIAEYRSDCESRNLALLVPKPSEGGFSAEDRDDLAAAVRQLAAAVPLDAARIAIRADGASAIVAYQLAARDDGVATGLILSQPRFREKPAETNPGRRVLWAFVDDSELVTKKIVPLLQGDRHPVSQLGREADAATITRWVDFMGRL